MAFTIRFLDEDNETVLDTQSVEEGATPVYAGQTPTKASTEANTYTFSGWSPEIVEAAADADYVAVYTSATRQYTITFYDEDEETVLRTQSVDYGAVPVYGGETPSKDPTAANTYSFSGWNPALAEVAGDASYVAVFTEAVRKYSVTFKDEDNETVLLAAAEYDYNTPADEIILPDDPEKEPTAQYPSIVFAGWSPAIADVTEDVVYKATYTKTTAKYRIQFLDNVGGVLQDALYEYGATPECELPDVEMAEGAWNPTIATVTEDAEYQAEYTPFGCIVRQDKAMGEGSRRAVVQIAAEADIDNLPDWFAPGSVAYLADMSAFWVMDIDGEWTESTADALALISLIG